MLTEETHAAGVADDKVAGHEEAAHEKRNWVRLTFDCNNRCIFCLDSDSHDGEIRSRDEIRAQILDGRKKGAQRLILSGGEPTIHPNYIDFIKLGRLAGYRWIQTVTNGRLFGYQDFIDRCLDAGLCEITFSVHGPNARIHDALVGVKGAYEQEMQGLHNALKDPRVVVNIDVVINKGNVKQLPEMLRMYTEMGVREFDLLQVVPFGRAFTEGRDTLFYDLEEMRPYLLEAFAYSKLPDMHVWLNRFPPQHLEGYESLIQDPYKLNDEVRGRKEEFAGLLDAGKNLDCRSPDRCKYCYLQKLCDTLDEVRGLGGAVGIEGPARFDAVRFDTEWEAQQGPVFGGDPASARKARRAAEAAEAAESTVTADLSEGSVSPGDPGAPATAKRVHLPMAAGPVVPPRTSRDLDALFRDAGAHTLVLVSPTLPQALASLERFGSLRTLSLELGSYEGLEKALGAGDMLGGHHLVRAVASTPAQARALLATGSDFEVQVLLTRDTAAWLETLEVLPARLSLRQPTYERLTEAREQDPELKALFATGRYRDVPVEDLPACITGIVPRAPAPTLDLSMRDSEGNLEIFRYTRRFILQHYRSLSLRCKSCVHVESCQGLHINYVRAHGYDVVQPVLADAE